MTTRDTPEAALAAAGFHPPENVCAQCGHSGGDHDLGNWCLLCPRPDVPARPIDGRLAAGWCYFASMTNAQKWEHGLAALDGWTLVPLGTAAADVQRDYARLRAALLAAANMIHMADFDPATLHEAILRTETICRAALTPSEPKAPNRPNPSKAEEKGWESWDPRKPTRYA